MLPRARVRLTLILPTGSEPGAYEVRLGDSELTSTQNQALRVCYFEKPEMDALLAAPDIRTRQGLRDQTLLLFLYNSGARASEAVGVTVGDLDLPDASQASVRLMGQGSKVRRRRCGRAPPVC